MPSYHAPPPRLGITPVIFGKPCSTYIPAVTTAGIYKQAGLPNITGRVFSIGSIPSNSGAFYYDGKNERGGAYDSASSQGIAEFDASRSNAIYGNSNTVQPNTLTARIYIKF